MVKHARRQSITAGYCGRMWRMFFVYAVIGILACGLAQFVQSNQTQRSWSLATARSLVRRAQMTNGSFAAALRNALGDTPQFVAFAMLDERGEIAEVVPDLTEFRDAFAHARTPGNDQLKLHIPGTQTVQKVSISMLPLNGDDSPAAQRALFMIADPEGINTWTGATMQYAGIASLLTLFVGLVHARWFRRHIAAPIAHINAQSRSEFNPKRWETIKRALPWVEMHILADRLSGAMHNAREASRHIEALQQASKHQLIKATRGFEHKLRRATDEALIDPLTGLRNRRYLEQELERMYAAQLEQGEDFAIVMFDLDDFKKHNDTFGHGAGDELLRFVGSVFTASIRDGDAAVRYGGDEFALLLRGTDWRTAVSIAERISRMFTQYVKQVAPESPVTISAGVASLSHDAISSGEALMQRADAALYRAKQQGKNLVTATAVR